ncbi:flavin-containing monooxygenase FMO GS-OX-like 2 [Gigantopelta aegis]|uniref:flavin-containing monooxygenase FMO GS-OX-like 2 n=1 Tax=Gigantopelta aegis TaxID=1735272 RepID=UPI001B88B91A|nr:flavin-containing monooxygenase FMO GS-OX-like 2 [Gigantopelta aegis]XP_041375779.1 flavin-containing monooxygenase FMO GS-OX-like 2 [Gigantopelta aegis]
MIRVAVIGAGASGLCALRHLFAKPATFDPICFEQSSRVGGTWVYTDKTGTDQYGMPIFSSMYQELLTNLPKESMAFPGFPFDKKLPSFIKSQDVLKYLEDYADHYDVIKKIKFYQYVQKVQPIDQEKVKVKWEVTYNDVRDTSQVSTEIFDGVIVCNGHYSVPLIPQIQGMDIFKGQIIHSHNYREPSPFENQRVVCLGASSSGVDIAILLSKVANKVYLSHNQDTLMSQFPENVEVKAGIKCLKENSVVFLGGEEEEEIDSLILCTGYRFVFPFLSEDCKLDITDERVTLLYKHMIHTQFPSLSFIGVCKLICPFPFFHMQVQLALAVLDGSVELPSKEDMDKDIEADFRKRLEQGLPWRHAHHMKEKQWGYIDELAAIVKCDPIPKSVSDLYNHVFLVRSSNFLNYKKKNYVLTGPETFEEVQ